MNFVLLDVYSSKIKVVSCGRLVIGIKRSCGTNQRLESIFRNRFSGNATVVLVSELLTLMRADWDISMMRGKHSCL